MIKSDFRHPMNQVSNTAALVPISCSCASSYGRDSGTERRGGGTRGHAPPLGYGRVVNLISTKRGKIMPITLFPPLPDFQTFRHSCETSTWKRKAQRMWTNKFNSWQHGQASRLTEPINENGLRNVL